MSAKFPLEWSRTFYGYFNLEPIYVKILLVKNLAILLDEICIYLNIDDIHVNVYFLATSKARVRHDMSNKQSLNFEKVHGLYFLILNILFTFSSQVLFWVWDIQYSQDLCCV